MDEERSDAYRLPDQRNLVAARILMAPEVPQKKIWPAGMADRPKMGLDKEIKEKIFGNKEIYGKSIKMYAII